MLYHALFRTPSAAEVALLLLNAYIAGRMQLKAISHCVTLCNDDPSKGQWLDWASQLWHAAAWARWAESAVVIEKMRLRLLWIKKMLAEFKMNEARGLELPGTIAIFPFSPEDRRERLKEISRAEQIIGSAKERLVEGNLRLVFHFSQKYLSLLDNDGMDLIQEGNRGLIRAAESWDWRREVKFGTYASWWIRQHIHQAVDGMRGKGDSPPKEDDADLRPWMVSLDSPAWDGERGNFHCSMAIDPGISLEDKAIEANIAERIDCALSLLDIREREVIRLRYGIATDHEWTLIEIGKKMGISYERVRQIQQEALEKLRGKRGMWIFGDLA